MSGQPTPQPDEQLQEYQHIGAYLRDLRLHYRLKITDVALRLHIRAKYIEAIEEGRIEELPGKVYTIGYIQNYAEFLGLNGQDVLQQYEEIEKLDKRQVFRVIEPTSRQGLPSRRLLALCVVIAIVAFVLAQFFSTSRDQDVSLDVRVDKVPQRIMEQAKQAIISTSVNAACLDTESGRFYPPCYGLQWRAPMVPFELKPASTIMELSR